MEFTELPGVPKFFLDFIAQDPSIEAFLPCRPTLQSLLSHAADTRQSFIPRGELCSLLLEQAASFESGPATHENIRKLLNTATVAVVTSDSPALFGGTLRSLLKCLTSVKLAAELEGRGVSAVPIISLHPDLAVPEDALSVCLPDGDGKLQRLRLQPPLPEPPLETAATLPVPSGMEQLLARAEELLAEPGQGRDIVDLLKQTFVPGVDLVLASGRFLCRLLERWGPVLLDSREERLEASEEQFGREPPDGRIQAALRDQETRLRGAGYTSEGIARNVPALLFRNAVLPAVAYVADPAEFYAFARTLPLYNARGVRPPVVWPRVSATLIDGRCRKLLQKYGLELKHLFQGAESLLVRLSQERFLPGRADRFDALAQEIQRRVSDLLQALPREDPSMEETIQASKTKMLYQIHKVREKFLASSELRRETMSRHIWRICNLLAPAGELQEQRLAALYFFLRYPIDFMDVLYGRIDVWKLEHQLIFPD